MIYPRLIREIIQAKGSTSNRDRSRRSWFTILKKYWGSFWGFFSRQPTQVVVLLTFLSSFEGSTSRKRNKISKNRFSSNFFSRLKFFFVNNLFIFFCKLLPLRSERNIFKSSEVATTASTMLLWSGVEGVLFYLSKGSTNHISNEGFCRNNNASFIKLRVAHILWPKASLFEQ